jgi:UDP-N-acetylglucosamine acyltransferase
MTISADARIHPSATVHPTAVLEGDVAIGAHTTVGAFSYLRGPLVIGEHNRINPHVVIGTEAEHKAKASQGRVLVGSHNVLTEFTVINRGTGERDTQIGDRCFLMDHTHVSHDCLVEDDVTIAHNVVLAGHTHVLEGANLGIATVTHQFSTIGSRAMVGMGAVVTRDVLPFCLVKGNPARFSRLNTHALKALGIDASECVIAGGEIKSKHPYVLEALERFQRHARRQPLRLGGT